MKKVISASRRTDIPAFYLKWFMQRIKLGYLDVANPFNRNQLKRVYLSPDHLAWIVFWSRNYQFFIKNQDFFNDYQLYFHFTINPQHAILEPGMLKPSSALKQMETLARKYNPDRIMWRYDPIVFYRRNNLVETNHKMRVFREFLRSMSQFGIKSCMISVMTIYSKNIHRAQKIPNFQFISPTKKLENLILRKIVDEAEKYNVKIFCCSNDRLLDIQGLMKGHCINGKLLNKLHVERVTELRSFTRKECGCTRSEDIGDYINTPCKYFCLYCYAKA
jgi:hypothetical protein